MVFLYKIITQYAYYSPNTDNVYNYVIKFSIYNQIYLSISHLRDSGRRTSERKNYDQYLQLPAPLPLSKQNGYNTGTVTNGNSFTKRN